MPDVNPGVPQRHAPLTIFPLVTPQSWVLEYLLLADALSRGILEITEKDGGMVPTLVARNRGEQDVLILDGEQLIGAKQNRMTNRSIILPARSETEIPVSCMEQGRWHFESREFRGSGQHSPSNVRRKARKVEARRAPERPPTTSDLAEAQMEVWSEIAAYSTSLNAASATGDLSHVYKRTDDTLAAWAADFPLVSGQVGLLAFLGGRPLGLDVVGGANLYERLHSRLLRGYLLDALEGRQRAQGEVVLASAEAFLEKVRAADRTGSPTAGRGTYRVLSRTVVGGELLDGSGLVHLSAFPVEEELRGDLRTAGEEWLWERPIASPNRRREAR